MKYNKKLLDKWFKIINYEVFNNEIIKPDMVIINEMQRMGLSVFYFDDIHSDFYGLTLQGDGYTGIALKASQTKTEFIDTLVHELCHVWQAQNGLEMNHGISYYYWMVKAKSIGLIK